MDVTGVLHPAKVFKVYGQFSTHLRGSVPAKFFDDFLHMLKTFLQLEAERLGLGHYHAAAWAVHGDVRYSFCYFFTFGGPEYHHPDAERSILCSNLARRLCEWLSEEVTVTYPGVVLGLWCVPLSNLLDESNRGQ
ncbi:E4 ORF3 [Bat mastadenovirus]|nr:E4 ORF3 [Bat mastadenovirus]